ncbi:Ig-like domain-containing protein [Bacteroidota bacterium]
MTRLNTLLFFLLLQAPVLFSQQNVDILIKPGISRAIDGNLELQRMKYFNLSESSPGVESKFNDPERLEYYIYDLEITFGRALGMVWSEKNYGSSIKEDAARPGYTDLTYLQSKLSPTNGGASQRLLDKWSPNMNVANHDRNSPPPNNAYPDFMPQYTPDGSDESMPTNTAAAGELAANLLKYKFTDWTRPAFYEIVNEPDWRFWSDPRFTGLHTQTHIHAKALGLETKIGGPCYSVGNFYKNDYASLSQITNFIYNTNANLDFYSYHIYDYMRWNEDQHDFTGSISSGLPSEGVLDAVANYMHKNFNADFKFVGSEHGGYIHKGDETAILEMLANKYFPGSGFLWEMKYREIVNHLMVNSCIRNTMTFMNHPHIVEKSVPFILLETSGWNPRYYSSLWIPWNYTDKTNWYETKLIDFYKLFNDIGGRRIYSYTDDPDIMQMGFVQGNKLYLVLHNQSNVDANLDLDFDGYSTEISGITRRLYGRLPDFRPYYYEERIPGLNNLVVEGRGSMVLVITFSEDIVEDEVLNEVPVYGDKVSTQFTGSTSVNISLPNHKDVQYAVLRVGISRDNTFSKEVNIKFNDTELYVQLEDCAPLLTETGFYATTKINLVDTALLKASNKVDISFPDGKSGGIGAAMLRAGYASTVPVDSVRVSNAAFQLFAGESKQLKAVVLPEVANNKKVSWSSENGSIAIVDTAGLVTGVAAGSTRIYVTTEDGGLMDSSEITVLISPPLKSYGDKDRWTAIYADDEGFVEGRLKEHAVDGDLTTFWHTEWQPAHTPLPHEIWVDMGDTLTFNEFIYTPRQDPWGPNAVIGDYEVYFSNDTSNWGTADASGSFSWNIGQSDYYKKIQYVSLGTDFYARYMRLAALTEHQNDPVITTSCAAELDVCTDATGIIISDSLDISVNGSATLKASTLPLGGKLLGQETNWISMNTSVATVTNGIVKGLNSGTGMIIAKTFDGSFADTCHVTVSYKAVSAVVISADSIELGLGQFTWLEASVLPEDALYKSFRWKSENPEIATVQHGFIRAAKLGRTKIMVESSDGGFTDTCIVDVIIKKYDAVFTIKDKSTGTAIDSAMVVFAGDTIYTDLAGKATFDSVPQGTYPLLVAAAHYQIFSNPAFSLTGNIASDIDLTATIYNIEFAVTEKDLKIPVFKAEVDIDERQFLTGSDGKVPVGLNVGAYDYIVSESYFEADSGSIKVAKDTAVSIEIKRLLADLRFIVYDGNGSAEPNVTVEMDGKSDTTTALGLANFKGIKVDTLYRYTISKDGFNQYSGEIIAKQDTSVDVYIYPVSNRAIMGKTRISLYPNPAGETIWIMVENNDSPEIEIELMDLSGRKLKVLNEPANPGSNRIEVDLDGLSIGTYLVSVKTGEQAESFRVVKK